MNTTCACCGYGTTDRPACPLNGQHSITVDCPICTATTCEDCTQAATTIVTIHDSAAPTTEFVWHDKPLCDGHRDELVEQIANEDEDVLGLTIDGMVSLVDGETYLPACERVS